MIESSDQSLPGRHAGDQRRYAIFRAMSIASMRIDAATDAGRRTKMQVVINRFSSQYAVELSSTSKRRSACP